MIEPAATALSDAADSAARAGSSLTAASDASRRGADLTNRLATSFDSMAGLGSVDDLRHAPVRRGLVPVRRRGGAMRAPCRPT